MRTRAAVAVQAIAAIAAITGIAVAGSAGDSPNSKQYVASAMPPGAQLVLVTSFASGDTLTIRPLGVGPQLPPRSSVSARLAGVVAPAVGTPAGCYGREALLNLISLLEPGFVAWAIAEPSYADTKKQWLVYLWAADGEFVNGNMIQGGFAMINRGDTPERYAVALSAAQARASSLRSGMWETCLNSGHRATL